MNPRWILVAVTLAASLAAAACAERAKETAPPATEDARPAASSSPTPPATAGPAAAQTPRSEDREVEELLDRIVRGCEAWQENVEDYDRRSQVEHETRGLVQRLGSFGRRGLAPLRRRLAGATNLHCLQVLLQAWIDRFPEDAIPEMERLAMSSGTTPMLRVEVLRQIVPRLPERAVDLLAAALADEALRTYEGRFHLIALLEKTGTPRATLPLIRILRDGGEPMDTRLQAALSLVQFPSAETIAGLEQTLREETHTGLRVRCFQSLYKILDCEVVPLAQDLLEDVRGGALHEILQRALDTCS